MSINDEAQQLLDMASSTLPQMQGQEAIEQLSHSIERACTLAGQGSNDARELFEIGQNAITKFREAIAGASLFYDTCATVAARHL